MPALVRPYRLPETLTLATRDAVRDAALRALTEVRRTGAAAWAVDASAVEQVDAAGLGLLLLLEKRARDAGLAFVLVRPSPAVRATLRAAALDDLLGERPG